MISHTSSTNGTPPVPIPVDRGRKPAAAPAPAGDVLNTSNAQRLQAALAATPEIRAEVVAHGHKLVVDPNYPPREIIEDVARLIVESEDLTSGE
jgi:hypothetical protein